MLAICRGFFLPLLLVSWSLPAHAVDWPSFQHDLEHTGRSTAVVDAAKLMLSWTAPDGYATPQIVGDTIYSTKSQGGFSGTQNATTQWATYISAFDLATGAIKWTHSGNNVFSSQAAVGGGLVVFYGGMSCSGCATPTPDAQQLVVLDAATGALRYKVLLPGELDEPGGGMKTMPLLVPNPADGSVMAYCEGFRTLCAVLLGPTNGSVVWKYRSNGTDFGLDSMPTLVGDAVVVNGTYQLFAFDRYTGIPISLNESHGGGGQTAVYDAANRHIYVAGNTSLTAYQYVNNTQIQFLWHRDGEIGYSIPGNPLTAYTGEVIGDGSIAIGPTGKVYVSGGSKLSELDPDTGATLRSVTGKFFTPAAPSLTQDILWIPNSDGLTSAYDLETLQLVRRVPGVNNAERSPGAGAFADGYFVMPHGDYVFSKGFDVWARPTARPLNISTRLRAQSVGGREIYAGFIITGSDPKEVCIRALGPSLEQFGITDTLPDPTIELHDSSTTIATNNNWKDTQPAEIQNSGLAPLSDSEAAMIVTLNPGAYTAIVRDANGAAGVALVEVYDQGRAAPVKLANISTRGFVESGENVMIAGFILGNEELPALVVIRAIGPSLVKFGSSEFLPDPTLELHDTNGVLVQSNDDWRDSQEAEITATGLAPENVAESAIVAILPPATYTAIMAGKNGQTGIGVIEVYHVR